MTDSTSVTVREDGVHALSNQFNNQDAMAVLRDTIARDCNDAEFGLFLETCKAMGLNPFQRQIHAVVRTSSKGDRTLTIQTGIDGYRLIGQRTGEVNGMDGPYWCGPDDVWHEHWGADTPPTAAKVIIYRKGVERGFSGVATYKEYVQTYFDRDTKRQKPNSMWAKMPASQLAKCAEALAWRRAFPAEMAGVYSDEEMAQADNEAPPAKTRAEARRDLGQGMAQAETAARDREQAKKAPAPEPAAPTTDEDARLRKLFDALPWMEPTHDLLTTMGRRIADLAPIVGAPVTRNALAEWAKKLPEGTDPYMEITAEFANKVIAAEAEERKAAGLTTEAVDPETGEVIEGEVVSELKVPRCHKCGGELEGRMGGDNMDIEEFCPKCDGIVDEEPFE